MTKIQIDRLRLENFKCHKNLELVFGGQNVSIYGDNAAGKTSIYDALTWLLFGKDSAGYGEKNLDIKPLDASGAVVDHNAITSVEAVLLVAEVPVTLRRTYREVWSIKRGGMTETFDGHTSEYYIDGVPCKKIAFDSRISQIVPEDTFRLLTSVAYFSAELHWQKRRAVLFDVAGAVSDREIMAGDGRFLPLSQALGNLTVEELRRKLIAQKKGLVGAKTDIPARLSECQQTVAELAGIDYDSITGEIHGLELEADRVAAGIHVARETDAERQRTELAHLEQQLLRDEVLLQNWEADITTAEKRIEDSRSRWVAVNQESFADGTCPACGQNLPFEQLRAATEAFDKGKQARLREIERTAAGQKEAKERAENQVANLQANIQQAQKAVVALRAALAVAGDGHKDDVAAQRLAQLRQEISAKQGMLGRRSVLERTKTRIVELQADARHAAEQLETVEALLFLTEEFTRYKTGFVEESINRYFRLARFRLFREQANGGIEERCDVVLDGVPYGGLNNGARINVGIDIINTLSRHFGVAVPLFVDNAESVTRLGYADTQVIRLVVSETDKELRCEYES